MFSRTELAERYTLTDRQVRRKLEALSPLIAGHVATGDRGKELYDDHALSLFDRMIQLEKEGLSSQAAAERITGDTSNLTSQRGAVRGLPDASPPTDELISALREQLKHSREEIEFLRIQIQKKDETLEAILPMLPNSTGQADGQHPAGQPARTLTRWGHLVALVRGK